MTREIRFGDFVREASLEAEFPETSLKENSLSCNLS